MASGLKLVKDTLGPDALILSTRTIRNGKMGILGKPHPRDHRRRRYTLASEQNPERPEPATRPTEHSPNGLTTTILHAGSITTRTGHHLRLPAPSSAGAARRHDLLHSRRPFPPQESTPGDAGDELKEMVKKLEWKCRRMDISRTSESSADSLLRALRTDHNCLKDNRHPTPFNSLLAQGISLMQQKQ